MTTDGGNTWTELNHPLLQGRNISGVRKNGNLILVTTSNYGGGGIGGGVYRSADGGTTFSLISGQEAWRQGSAFDIVHDRTNPDRFYVVRAVSRHLPLGRSRRDLDQRLVRQRHPEHGHHQRGEQQHRNGGGRQRPAVCAVLQNGQARYIGYTSNQGVTWTAMDLPLTPDAGGGADEGLNPRDKPGGQGRSTSRSSSTRRTRTSCTSPAIVRIPRSRTSSVRQDYSGRIFRGDTRITATGAVPSPQWAHMTHSNSVAQTPTGGTASSSSPHADSREMTFDANGNLVEVDDARRLPTHQSAQQHR